MSINQQLPSGRRHPFTKPRCVDEAPEVKQALAKAEDFAKRAATAIDSKDRDYCERMHRKWLGIADGWRVIAEFDQP